MSESSPRQGRSENDGRHGVNTSPHRGRKYLDDVVERLIEHNETRSYVKAHQLWDGKKDDEIDATSIGTVLTLLNEEGFLEQWGSGTQGGRKFRIVGDPSEWDLDSVDRDVATDGGLTTSRVLEVCAAIKDRRDSGKEYVKSSHLEGDLGWSRNEIGAVLRYLDDEDQLEKWTGPNQQPAAYRIPDDFGTEGLLQGDAQ